MNGKSARRWLAETVIAGAIVLLDTGGSGRAADPDALWKIVHDKCVPDQEQNGDPARTARTRVTLFSIRVSRAVRCSTQQKSNLAVPQTIVSKEKHVPDNPQQNPAHQTAQTVQTSGRATSDAVRRAGEFPAGTTRQIGEAGADAVNRSGQAGSDGIRQGTQQLAESQQQIVRTRPSSSKSSAGKVAQAVQGTTEDVRSFMVLPGAARGGLQDLQQGVTGLIEGVVQTNMRH